MDINLPTMVEHGGPQLSPTEEGGGEGVRKGQPAETEEVEGERGTYMCVCVCCVCMLASKGIGTHFVLKDKIV